MTIERKSALLMDMPDQKLPGFYAQIVKALASKAPLFDRDKELLIFNSPSEREHAYAIMEQYKIPYETMDVLLLPASIERQSGFTDYGFVSRSGNSYVYAEAVYLFTLHSEKTDAEPAQAILQLEEHLLASFVRDDSTYYVTEAQSDELMQRIAQAYGCSIRTVTV